MPIKKIIFNTAFIYLKLFANVLALLFTTRIILEALGPEDYGIWSLVGGVVALFSVIYSGLVSASMRFISHALGSGNVLLLKQNFAVSLLLHLIIGLLFIIAIEIAGFFLFGYSLRIPVEKVHVALNVFHFTVLATFLYVIIIPFEAILNAHEDIAALTLIDVIGILLRIVVVLVISYFKDSLYHYGFLTLIVQLIISIVKIIYCWTRYSVIRINIFKFFNKPLMKELVGFTFWNFFGSLAWVATSQFKGIFLNMFYGVTINGPNGIATNVGGQLNQASNSLTIALNPSLVKSEGIGNREKMLYITFLATKYSFFVFAILALPLLIELPTVLKIWLKNVPIFTVDFCRLIIIYLLFEKSTFEITNALRAVGNVKGFQLTETFIQILNIPFSYFFLQCGYSPNVVFVVSVVLILFICVERLYFANRILHINAAFFLKNTVLKTFVFFIISGVFSLFIRSFFENEISKMLITFLVSGFTMLVLFIFFGIGEHERKLFFNFLKNFNK